MADRQYTSKQRAKRIDLGYFKRSHPSRRTRLILSVTATLAAGLWLLVYAVRGDHTIYTSGPVAPAHAMFEKDCRVCHVPSAAGPAPQTAGLAPSEGGFFLKVTDQACTTCHAGPIHHESQVSTPSCATCHIEHEGNRTLARSGDAGCTTCHEDVALTPGAERRFEPKVPSFAGHPEFAIDIRDGDAVRRIRLHRTAELKDTAQINLNHQKHMRAGLSGLEELQKLRGPSPHIVQTKGGLQLSCTYCHDTESTRTAMQPVSYQKHCGPACHPLDFDGRFPEAETPHLETSLVHAYLRTLYVQAFEDCQAVGGEAPSTENEPLRKRCQELDLIADAAAAPTTPAADAPPADAPRGGRLGRRGAEAPAAPVTEPPAQEPAEVSADAPRGRRLMRGGEAALAETPAAPRGAAAPRGPGIEWVAEQLRSTERLVYRQKCGFCHVMVTDAGRRPETAPTAIPVRWMSHAVFNHGVHRVVTCSECHQAETSTETTDVLLPNVKVCQDCHQERGGARTACVTCHLYHDKTRERPLDGPFTIRQLAGGARNATTPPATK